MEERRYRMTLSREEVLNDLVALGRRAILSEIQKITRDYPMMKRTWERVIDIAFAQDVINDRPKKNGGFPAGKSRAIILKSFITSF
ncbi:hypothetical protein MKW98_012902 [Papaver atlanticum]|uniref:Uncharacterized protein n=1 Tax=Papaver atlanticum TaxID=357466 RepID=A0AAD4XFX0_9MAGN|nr:hypothetical protein MKW98_012902 [Papaver atlanticum]